MRSQREKPYSLRLRSFGAFDFYFEPSLTRTLCSSTTQSCPIRGSVFSKLKTRGNTANTFRRLWLARRRTMRPGNFPEDRRECRQIPRPVSR